MEISSQGLSEREIGSKLQVSNILAHRDLVYLRKQALEEVEKAQKEYDAALEQEGAK